LFEDKPNSFVILSTTILWERKAVRKKIISICLLIFLGSSVFAQEGVVSQNIQVGVEVPNFEIQVLTSEGSVMTNIRDYRGRVVILEFWATYCGPWLPAAM
jgi:thiol-disulfide isomerase/thioredoxin